MDRGLQQFCAQDQVELSPNVVKDTIEQISSSLDELKRSNNQRLAVFLTLSYPVQTEVLS